MNESLEVVCQCGGRFSCSAEQAGQSVTCPHCDQTLDLPDAESIRPAANGPTTLDSLLPVESPRPDELPFMQPSLLQPEIPQASSPNAPLSLHQIGGTTTNGAEDGEAAGEAASAEAARASDPARVQVEYLRWFIHYPTWPLIWLGLLACAVALGVWNWWLTPFALFAAAMNYWYWQRVRIHFRDGCVLPGVVVSLEPLLFAYATDMSLGTGEYPAVKIVRGSRAALNAEAKVGARLVGVAWYGTSDRQLPYWEDVDPRPIETATSDPAVLAAVCETVTEEDYAQLEQWRTHCPQQPGLFFVQPDGTVKRYDIYNKHRD